MLELNTLFLRNSLFRSMRLCVAFLCQHLNSYNKNSYKSRVSHTVTVTWLRRMTYEICLEIMLNEQLNKMHNDDAPWVLKHDKPPSIWFYDLQPVEGMSNETMKARRSWWRHQMGPFYALLALCEGNPPVAFEFTSQRPVTRNFDVFLWSAPE